MKGWLVLLLGLGGIAYVLHRDRGGAEVASGARAVIWKVLYDFERPFWMAFGRVAFVECQDESHAQRLGREAAQAAEPDATITRVWMCKRPPNKRGSDSHNTCRLTRSG